jgi:predicted DNA-binding protein YlxM (UPF0122 family)
VSEDMSVERLSVMEAAEALGVTRDAIHKRIRRGTIEHEKGEDGRFYVYVDTSTSRVDQSAYESKDESKVEVLERLIEGQQDRIAFLERELERRGDETVRLHQIVAGLTQANAQLAARVPELEAPQEAAEAPEPAEDEPERAEPRPDRVEAQEGVGEASERSWWRRMFGS